MEEIFELGSKVTPITKAGLWLADSPVDGTVDQNRFATIVFTGVGEVIGSCTITIDYDTWGEDYEGVGKVRYTDYLIKCDNGIGWGGGVKRA